MKIFVTEESPGIAGIEVQASSLEEAEHIAGVWRMEMIVPPTFKVLGMQIEETDLGKIQRTE